MRIIYHSNPPAWQYTPYSRPKEPAELLAELEAKYPQPRGAKDMEGDYRQLGEDVLNAADTPVWDMLADAGIDLDRVTVQPDGVWNVDTDTGRVAFGPSELPEETGDGGEGLADGWDWARYGEDGQIEAQDYAAGSDDLIAVLIAALGT